MACQNRKICVLLRHTICKNLVKLYRSKQSENLFLYSFKHVGQCFLPANRVFHVLKYIFFSKIGQKTPQNHLKYSNSAIRQRHVPSNCKQLWNMIHGSSPFSSESRRKGMKMIFLKGTRNKLCQKNTSNNAIYKSLFLLIEILNRKPQQLTFLHILSIKYVLCIIYPHYARENFAKKRRKN